MGCSAKPISVNNHGNVKPDHVWMQKWTISSCFRCITCITVYVTLASNANPNVHVKLPVQDFQVINNENIMLCVKFEMSYHG